MSEKFFKTIISAHIVLAHLCLEAHDSFPLSLLYFLPPFPLSSVGRLLIEFSSQMTMERVQKENPNVTEGGRYTPPDCRPRWKVCTHNCVRTNGPTDYCAAKTRCFEPTSKANHRTSLSPPTGSEHCRPACRPPSTSLKLILKGH